MSSPDAAGGAALRRCVACGIDAFAEKYWAQAPLLTRAADLGRDGFADLLDAAAVDELVSRRGLRTPFLRMAKDGTVLASARFTRGGGAGASIGDQAADDRVLARLADGATLVLQALHRSWPPLIEFSTHLAAELGHPVQVNAYITPPQNQGFAPHYDVHDVFVLQVAGRKHWTIHEPAVRDPLPDQPWEQHRAEVAARVADDPPLIDAVLEPGDAVYLPRGTIHAATALGETSIHLTVGVHPITRYALVKHLLDAAAHDPQLRASLPMGADLGDPAVLAPELAATVAALRDYLADDAVAEVAGRVGAALRRQTRPEPISPLAQLTAAEALRPDTPLRARFGQRAEVRSDPDAVTITVLDRAVTLPADTAAAMALVLRGSVFTPSALAGLADGEALDLSRRLLREGLIVPA